MRLIDRLASPERAEPGLAVRVACGLPLPLLALVFQPWIESPGRSLTWFLFFPAVFLSGWIGGFVGGITAAFFSVGLVYVVVLDADASSRFEPHDMFVQVAVFLVAGILVSLIHQLLRNQARSLAAARRAAERDARALAESKATTEAAYDEIRRSERLLLQLFEQAPVGIALADEATGRVLAANHQFSVISGWATEALLGRPWIELAAAEDRADALSSLARLLEGGPAPVTLQQRFLRPDGSHVWCRTSVARVVALESAAKHLVMIEDVTARRQVELQVQDTLARLRAAVRVGELGIWHLDLVDGTLAWDDRVCEFYAVPDEVRRVGVDYEFWRSRLHPDDRTRLEEAARRLREGGELQENVFRVMLPDGGVRWLQSVAVGERDVTGRLWRVIGVNRDVTRQQAGQAAPATSH